MIEWTCSMLFLFLYELEPPGVYISQGPSISRNRMREKDTSIEEERETMQKQEMALEQNEEELSDRWKLFNVIIVSFAFMMINTGGVKYFINSLFE